uniref:Uncharacterized protein n=1 Tax=Rhizophagus irregularis (strain DAOM 181602 / DAOM 197198 / MUCL 43194) TaxID=747089 RepID=U9TJB5_RHIID
MKRKCFIKDAFRCNWLWQNRFWKMDDSGKRIQQNVHLMKCQFGEMSILQNIPLAKMTLVAK